MSLVYYVCINFKKHSASICWISEIYIIEKERLVDIYGLYFVWRHSNNSYYNCDSRLYNVLVLLCRWPWYVIKILNLSITKVDSPSVTQDSFSMPSKFLPSILQLIFLSKYISLYVLIRHSLFNQRIVPLLIKNWQTWASNLGSMFWNCITSNDNFFEGNKWVFLWCWMNSTLIPTQL